MSGQVNLHVDRVLMVRVLVNLLTNAIKYTESGGTITIKGKKLANEKVQVTIQDTGCGIAADDLPYVFDKFWQVNKRFSGSVQSTGLGLTFCKFAVEAHQGQIEVVSKLEKGTSFVMEFQEGEVGRVPTKELSVKTKPKADEKRPSREDLLVIRSCAEKIKDMPIYKISRIEAALNGIDSDKAPEVTEWKEKVLLAVYNNDKELFRVLTSKK